MSIRRIVGSTLSKLRVFGRFCPQCGSHIGTFGDGTVGLVSYYDKGYSAYYCVKCRYQFQISGTTVEEFFESLSKR